MANPLKQLAGETAVYGLSSILARIVNFMLVPLYTYILATEEYGVTTEFLAYIAILQVVLVLGLETGSFRYANKEGAEPDKVYSSALTAVFGLNAAFLALVVVFSGQIASALGYDGYRMMICYVGGILFCDSITAILFAKLRQEHKAVKFATLKTIKILTETLSNLFLFLVYPAIAAAHPSNPLSLFVTATPGFTYPIFAIFVSCILCLVLFIPDLLKFSFKYDGKLLKSMLLYSLPLMVAALPGIVNDFLDRVLFRYFDTNSEAWRSSLGVYQAAVKLAVIMNLFIQMFRYAAEPFFFQRSRDKHSKELYAGVMEFFVAFCGLIFLGVIMYIDVISLLLGRDFRSGLGVVPVMLVSYILLGMLFNVSMWYKLSNRTDMAIWITLAGLLVTAAVNIAFMPRFSYWASAFGHLASYLVMFVVSAVLGAKYNPYPYRWGRIASFFALMGVFYCAALFIGNTWFSGPGIHVGQLAINTVLILIYLATCCLMLRGRYREIKNF
ncbi:MAG: oligosaccharide flippase family protein [Bacteroidales bacterium]|nr:oligosaccharide flippase family protein [Bacteroidales bacterium]MBR5924579.1 oligosaccharide flippase family protein [Bacteroidales bacterium]